MVKILSDSHIEIINDMVKNRGAHVVTMAETLHVSPSTISRFCREHDIDISYRTLNNYRFLSQFTDYEKERIVTLCKHNSIRNVSRLIDLSEYRIKKLLKLLREIEKE